MARLYLPGGSSSEYRLTLNTQGYAVGLLVLALLVYTVAQVLAYVLIAASVVVMVVPTAAYSHTRGKVKAEAAKANPVRLSERV